MPRGNFGSSTYTYRHSHYRIHTTLPRATKVEAEVLVYHKRALACGRSRRTATGNIAINFTFEKFVFVLWFGFCRLRSAAEPIRIRCCLLLFMFKMHSKYTFGYDYAPHLSANPIPFDNWTCICIYSCSRSLGKSTKPCLCHSVSLSYCLWDYRSYLLQKQETLSVMVHVCVPKRDQVNFKYWMPRPSPCKSIIYVYLNSICKRRFASPCINDSPYWSKG